MELLEKHSELHEMTESAFSHMEQQLAGLREVKQMAIAAEEAAREFDDLLSDAKACMEFVGIRSINPVKILLTRRAGKSLDCAEAFSSNFSNVLTLYRDALEKLDGAEKFDIPFEYLDELCESHSLDNFRKLSDITEKSRKLWARIYESLKLIDQLEAEIMIILEEKR